MQAERAYRDAIFDRKLRGGRTIGEIRIYELRALAQASAEATIGFLTRGQPDAVDMIACTMLAGYCVAADPHAKVKDTIKASIVTDVFNRAEITAAKTMQDVSAKLAHELLAVAAAQEITVN